MSWFCPELGILGVGLAPLASQNQKDPGKSKLDYQDLSCVSQRILDHFGIFVLDVPAGHNIQRTTSQDSTKMINLLLPHTHLDVFYNTLRTIS